MQGVFDTCILKNLLLIRKESRSATRFENVLSLFTSTDLYGNCSTDQGSDHAIVNILRTERVIE